MKSLIDYLYESTNKKFVDIFVIYDDKFLILRRANYMKRYPGKWCLPGGSIDKNESATDAIIRELREETNIDVSNVEYWKTHTYPDGSTSDIFYIKLDSDKEVKLSREHAAFKWIDASEISSKKWAGELETIILKFFKEHENLL